MHALHQFQLQAIAHLETLSTKRKFEIGPTIRNSLYSAGIVEDRLERLLQNIRNYARIALHFHPDRLWQEDRNVIAGLLQDGIFKNQYETGISSGSPTAYPGGARDVWEQKFFGGNYHKPEINPADRPKYGALIMMGHADGPAPRFGSCYFILKPEVSKRSTFTYGGNQDDLQVLKTGSLDTFEVIIAALFKRISDGENVLGWDNLTLIDLITRLESLFSQSNAGPPQIPMLGRALDSFVEAQVHGDVSLYANVEALVVDPSYKESKIEDLCHSLCSKFHIQMLWHPGFQLHVKEVPTTFRDYPVKLLAHRIGREGIVNAFALGIGANLMQANPEDWKEFGSYRDGLTCFRRLWHVLVKKGEPLFRPH